MRKILTLGVSAMSLAALVAAGTGCSGDDDDDGGSGNYGGIWNITVTTGGNAVSGADFYESYEGDTSSLRDIPTDACVEYFDAANPSTGADPVITYEDVGDALTAVSGASTVTLIEDTTPSFAEGYQYLSAATTGAVDDATYSLNIDGSEFATIDVPALPFPLSVTGNTVTWTTMGASDVYIALVRADVGYAYLCHTTDDGSFDFTSTAATQTSGFVAVIGANYAEVGHTDGTVIVVGQSNDPFDTDQWAPYGF